MNSIRRFTVVRLIVALAMLTVLFTGHARAVCPNLTINNAAGMGTLKLKLLSGGVPTTFTVTPGVNTFGPYVPVGGQSSAGANFPLTNGCTPCFQADIVGGGTVCVAWCYDPSTCTVTVNITPCSPTPPNCIP